MSGLNCASINLVSRACAALSKTSSADGSVSQSRCRSHCDVPGLPHVLNSSHREILDLLDCEERCSFCSSYYIVCKLDS